MKLHSAASLPVDPEFKDLIWWTEQGHEAGIDPVTGERVLTLARNSIDPPMWVIEVAHEITPAESGHISLQDWYRIIARGSGKSNAGASVVESTVLRSWPVSGQTESETPVISGRVAWRE